MPSREKAICQRLGKFRSLTGLSQAEFARVVGLDFNAYASYEYARSQLNYPAAWRIISAFRLLNPTWLAEGQGILFEIHFVSYPPPEQIGLGPRAPFSVVYERFLKPLLAQSTAAWMLWPGKPFPTFHLGTDVQGRLAARDIISELLMDWICAQPDSQLNGFLNEFLTQGLSLLKKYPPEPSGKLKTERGLQMFSEAAKRRMLIPQSVGKNILLTDVAASGKLAPVKSQLKNLLADLNRLTRELGKKTKLAEFLGAPLTSVSRWLSGEREPGGETTLKMLRWVQEQESQPNALGSAASTAKGKTQIGKSSYEKPIQVRKNR